MSEVATRSSSSRPIISSAITGRRDGVPRSEDAYAMILAFGSPSRSSRTRCA